jgi:hypothetical protein
MTSNVLAQVLSDPDKVEATIHRCQEAIAAYRKQIAEINRELDQLKNPEALSWEHNEREKTIARRRERQERIEEAYRAF